MHAQPDLEAKRAAVREQQKPIAEWLQSVLDLKGWTARDWALKAGLGKDTVSRGLKEGYEHVTSMTTIGRLAKAAAVPMPIHLVGARGVPTTAALMEILRELFKLVPEREWPDEVLLPLARALRHTLLEIAEEGDGHDDPAHARVVARIAARKLLDEDNEPRGPKK
jgi:hypothetical protein